MNYMALPGIPCHIRIATVIKNRDYIVRQVCNYFETDLNKLKRKTRERKIVQTRYIMFYYLYTFTGMTFNDIAQMFKPAVNDHTTVIHGVNSVRDQLSLNHDTEVKHHIKNITI